MTPPYNTVREIEKLLGEMYEKDKNVLNEKGLDAEFDIIDKIKLFLFEDEYDNDINNDINNITKEELWL